MKARVAAGRAVEQFDEEIRTLLERWETHAGGCATCCDVDAGESRWPCASGHKLLGDVRSALQEWNHFVEVVNEVASRDTWKKLSEVASVGRQCGA